MTTQRVVNVLFLAGALCATTVFSADWPQWRGPNRDGISPETGLLETWPEGGPQQLWTASGLGDGYSQVAVADGTIYVTGADNRTKTGFVTALTLAGKKKWKQEYGPSFDRSYRGARSCPTVYDGKLYIMSGAGQLCCLRASDGKVLGRIDTFEKFGGRNITWGIAESPLIVDGKVVCTPGGPDAALIAVDTGTGKTTWKTEGLGDKSAYCSAMAYKHGGQTQICTATSRHVIGVNAANGKLLWKIPFKNRFSAHPNTPLYQNGHVYVTAGYDLGGVNIDLSRNGRSASKAWDNKTLDTHHGGVVLIDGYIYGASWRGNGNGNWVCLDFKTGDVKYDHHWHSKGSIIAADGMLYVYNEKGHVGLVRATPKAFDLVSSFNVRHGGGPHWAHPAIANGVLYIRHGDALAAYDIAAD